MCFTGDGDSYDPIYNKMRDAKENKYRYDNKYLNIMNSLFF